MSSSQQPHRIDARGKPGAAGPSGDNGTRSGSDGGHGHKGQAAGSGGQIAATATLPSAGRMLLTGVAICPRDDSPALPVSLPLDTLSVVQLLAQGGAGGRGGDGGNGARGHKGSKGSDATRYSSGGNGGPGGDGGNGGNAGTGGTGGDGGTVHLSLAEADLDLALLFEWDVSAGQGGQPGTPGAGGPGGSGGDGGDSYSWTETETYTDSNGSSATRTVSHSNSGGSRGPSGDSGMSGASAVLGKQGQDGAFHLEVGGQTFLDRYRLRCTGYRVESSHGDRVLEFGERDNRVKEVLLGNSSDLPSPAAHTELQLAQRPGVLPHPVSLPLPPLGKDQSQAFDGLTFDLEEAPQDRLPSLHERLRRVVSIEPQVHFTRLDRVADEAKRPTEIEVTFPVELQTLSSPTSLMPGQTIQQRWVVRNLSNFEFPTAGRKLTVELAKPSGEGNLRVHDSHGEPLPLGPEPITYLEIEPMPAGGELIVTVYLSFEEGTPPYSAVQIWAALRLTPRYGGEPREIQRNPIAYSAALAYRGSQAEALLITHSGCTADEVQEWGQTFERLGLSWDVWDASWHGDLPILTLAQKIAGKLVVILNVPFQGPDRGALGPVELMDLADFREAVSRHGLSFYLVGSRSELFAHLVPQLGDFQPYSSLGDYLDSFGERTGHNPEVPQDMTTSLAQVSIARFHVAADPKPEDLQAQAKKLLGTLRERFPDRRFAISCHFQPDVESGWFRKRTYGYLRIRQLPDADARAVVVREVYRKTGEKPAFIRSTENLLGLFSAMDFDDKLSVANMLNDTRRFAIEPLADAWLLDLGEEQMVLRRSRVHTGKKRIRQLLNRTRDLCQHDFRHDGLSLEVESALGQLLIRMAAGLSFLAKARLHWSDHRMRLLGGTNEVEISEVIDEMVDGLLDTNFGADPLIGRLPKARAEAEATIAVRRRQLEAAAAQVESISAGAVSRKDSAVEALVRWDLRDYLESDSCLSDGLYTLERLDELQKLELDAKVRRGQLLQMFQEAAKAGELPEDAPFWRGSPDHPM